MAIKKELVGGNPLCFPYVFFYFIFFHFSLGSCYLCSNLSLSFLFRFVPRVTSNREEMRFGEVAVLKQISMLPLKKIFLSARMSDCFEKKYTHAPGCYLTFISFALFDLSNIIFSKKFIFTCCSVLTDFCQYLHLPLNLFFLCSFGGKSPKINCDSS